MNKKFVLGEPSFKKRGRVIITQAITSKLHRDILELETQNMLPILEAIGIKHDPQKLLDGLKKEQEIVTIYKEEKLMALLRYTKEGTTARVWSIQLQNPQKNKTLLLPLLKKTYQLMKQQNITQIISVVQKSNQTSLDFHQKLGFKVQEDFEKAVRFCLSLNDLPKRIVVKI